jgi:AraC family transcriptional regulator of adaptative response / DNA-3-methyladenine glycosylase II
MLLRYEPPLDWEHLQGFLARRAIAGVERCDETRYERTVAVGGARGTLRVRNDPRRSGLRVDLAPELTPHAEEIGRRLRGLFDLDHDPAELETAFRNDPLLVRLLRRHPGIRVPGAWDGFEIAVRAVAGQQVSVSAARNLLGRITAHLGEPLGDDRFLFPEPARFAELDEGMPGARLATLHAVAALAAAGQLALERGSDPAVATAALRAIRGIGDWTAGYIAMRALGDRDAFPAGDLVLRKVAGNVSARELASRAENWRPLRAYACMLLWSAA